MTFSYPDTDVPALKNASFVIEPGEHVAIIGRIGSGKSTIQKLLLGLYEPDAGQILIDGIDINQIDPAEHHGPGRFAEGLVASNLCSALEIGN